MRIVKRDLKLRMQETHREAVMVCDDNQAGFGPRLYWTLGDGTLKSLDL